jgi:hypothetical protein
LKFLKIKEDRKSPSLYPIKIGKIINLAIKIDIKKAGKVA